MKKSSLTQTQTVLLGLALLLGLDFFMFVKVLFTSEHLLAGGEGTDLFSQFVAWRHFGFSQLRSGNFALWNPHIFSGAPYFGGFQAALLYPPNWLFLILPLEAAINWSIALNVFLIGAFTYLWAAHRRLHPAACFLAGALIMFCGAHFLHVYAGHLPNLCTMVWAPLLFLAIDGVFQKPDERAIPPPSAAPAGKKRAKPAPVILTPRPIPRPIWALLGIFAVAMQVLAGHPQYFFYTGITASIYCIIRLVRARPFAPILGWLLLMPAGGLGLSAVQLLTGMDATKQTIRSNAVSFKFAAMFSFPPENFLTLLAPWFFGDISRQSPYWGRCYIWEMSLFFSVTGLVLALYAVFYAERRRRNFAVTLCLILFLLALGNHTPLFQALYYHVPGFDKFRGISKFTFQALLFLVLLAAVGLDRLITERTVDRRFTVGVAVTGALFIVAAFWIKAEALSSWMHVGDAIVRTGESYLNPAAYRTPAFAAETQAGAVSSLLLAGGTLFAIAMLLGLVSSFDYAVYGLVLLAVIEIFSFAFHSRDTFDARETVIAPLKQFLDAHPGDYRIINAITPNSAMQFDALDMWGFDPGVLRRYAELMYYTQGLNPDDAEQYLTFQRLDRLYALTRLGYMFTVSNNQLAIQQPPESPMQHLQLLQRYRVVFGRNPILAAMESPDFDFRKEVILENEPAIKPDASGAEGTLRVESESTDQITIEADLPHPEILLVTDTWCEGWRAVPLPGSAQSNYEVVPGDYILRAVPLSAGHHHFRIEYLPRAYVIGKWISICSLILYAAGAGFALWQMRRAAAS